MPKPSIANTLCDQFEFHTTGTFDNDIGTSILGCFIGVKRHPGGICRSGSTKPLPCHGAIINLVAIVHRRPIWLILTRNSSGLAFCLEAIRSNGSKSLIKISLCISALSSLTRGNTKDVSSGSGCGENFPCQCVLISIFFASNLGVKVSFPFRGKGQPTSNF